MCSVSASVSVVSACYRMTPTRVSIRAVCVLAFDFAAAGSGSGIVCQPRQSRRITLHGHCKQISSRFASEQAQAKDQCPGLVCVRAWICYLLDTVLLRCLWRRERLATWSAMHPRICAKDTLMLVFEGDASDASECVCACEQVCSL